ncbi:MAG: ABC transporter permease [Vicinamibacterales bacterium]
MQRLARIAAVTAFVTTPVSRSPLSYAIVFLWPVILLYMYWLIGGMRLGRHVLFGSLVAFALNSGVVSLPQRVLDYRSRHLQDMFVASPVDQLSYMLGHGFSRLLYALPGCVCALAILLLQREVPIRSLPLVLLVVLLSWVIGCAIGFFVASRAQTSAQLSAMANLLGLLLVLVPPVMYPLELIASGWRSISLLLPSSSAAHIIRIASGASGAANGSMLALAWAVLVLWLCAGIALCSRASTWREE